MLSRRHFLRQASAVALGFSGLHTLAATSAARGWASPAPDGFGPLVPDPAGVFDLPEGFSYRVFSRMGDVMTDGFLVPGRPDGMAALPGPDGLTLLVRNHELAVSDAEAMGPFGARFEQLGRLEKSALYDAGLDGVPCPGGTTTVVYDTRAQQMVSQHLSLVGTVRNCAGGPTPWNSWITCEETVQRAGDRGTRDHGYNFEVPATTSGLAEPVPLIAMGRFNHEAVAVDPASGIVFQTEDAHDGLIYRFLPNEPGALHKGGRLQALAVEAQPSLDTRNWDEQTVQAGVPMRTRWIDMDGVEAPDNDLRLRGFSAGAARFARGEGMWYGRGAVYFACTNGGEAKKGQIWRYVPSEHEGQQGEKDAPGTLELFVEPNDGALIDNADNLTVTPWGDLILCEDGSGEQYLVGVTPSGDLYKFGRNATSDSELAGATFSPDGTTLFVNIQHDGLTLAITGPWGRG
jgi:secreted PhoX family phosphatase